MYIVLLNQWRRMFSNLLYAFNLLQSVTKLILN